MTFLNGLFYLLSALVVGWPLFHLARGRSRFPKLLADLEGEEILLSRKRVFTRFSFPLIKRVTFTRLFLTRYRFVACHWLTRSLLLQAPVGPEGAAGTSKGSFEAEKRGKRRVLLLRTTLRGGGRVRFHVKDPEKWVAAMREN